MSTAACIQPGCTGGILDGYCDVCGSPGPAADGSPSATSGGSASAVTGGADGRCAQPGCTGTVADGYCDACGSPGPQGASATSGTMSVATMPAGAVPSPSTVSRTSDQL